MTNEKIDQIVMILPDSFDNTPRIQRECNILEKNCRIHVIDTIVMGSDIENVRENSITFHHVVIPRFKLREERAYLSRWVTLETVLAKLVKYLVFYFHTFILLMRIFERNRILCIHCHHLHSLPLGVFFKRVLKCRVIYDAHEFYYFHFRRFAPRFLAPALCKIEEKLGHNVDLIITRWRTQAEFLSKKYGLRNSIVFPNLPPPTFFEKEKIVNEKKREFGILPDDFVIFYGGTLRLSYKLNELLDACNVLVNRHKITKIKLLIAGSGPLPLKDLKNRAKTLNIERYCVFLGRVSYKEVSNLYYASDLVYAVYDPILVQTCHMMPSQKIFAAMICQKPVITSCRANVKLVDRAKCGLAVKPEAEEIAVALLKFIKNQGMRENMGMNGYQYYIRNLSWEKYSDMFLSAYKKLLKR